MVVDFIKPNLQMKKKQHLTSTEKGTMKNEIPVFHVKFQFLLLTGHF